MNEQQPQNTAPPPPTLVSTGKTPMEFANVFQLDFHPYGCAVKFSRRDIDNPEQVDPVMAVMMTPEHLKVMAYILWDSINRVETAQSVKHRVFPDLLTAHGIDMAQWAAFWGDDVDAPSGDPQTQETNNAKPVQAVPAPAPAS